MVKIAGDKSVRLALRLSGKTMQCAAQHESGLQKACSSGGTVYNRWPGQLALWLWEGQDP